MKKLFLLFTILFIFSCQPVEHLDSIVFDNQQLSTVRASSSGTFNTPVTVPQLPPGSYVIKLQSVTTDPQSGGTRFRIARQFIVTSPAPTPTAIPIPTPTPIIGTLIDSIT